MKTILSLLACLVAWCGSTNTTRAQGGGGEPVLQKAETLRISITGVPLNDQSSMAGQAFVVSNEGTVSLTHLTGAVRAAGLTPSQLARNIERAYKEAGIYTKPTINVGRIMSADTQQVVIVGGNVKLPGNCVFRPNMKIHDAITERGGFDDFANPSRVQLMRKGTTREIDLHNVSSHQENNVVLEPGDSIIVRKKRF